MARNALDLALRVSKVDVWHGGSRSVEAIEVVKVSIDINSCINCLFHPGVQVAPVVLDRMRDAAAGRSH